MEIGSLERDVKDITSRSLSTLNNFEPSITLHTEKKDIQINYEMILFLDNKRDYVTELSEKYFVQFLMPTGDFIYDVFKERHNLEITITINTVDGYDKTITMSDRFKAVLSEVNKGYDEPSFMSVPREELNKGDITPVTIEATSRVFEVIKNIPANCNLSTVTVEDAIYYGFQEGLEKSQPAIEGQPVDITFDIAKPHNNITYNKISTLSSGVYKNVSMLQIPTYLQEEYGVYNGGICTFLQKYCHEQKFQDSVFVYPLYDFFEYDNTENNNRMSVYIPMTGKYDLSEGTYFRDGDILKVLGTSDSAIDDKDEDVVRNVGTTTVNVHPKSLLNRSAVKVDGEKDAYYDQKEISREDNFNSLRDGSTNIKYVGTEGNMYKVRSEMMVASSVAFEISWLNGNFLEVYPGMPVCVMRETMSNGIITYKGRITSCYSSFSKTRNTNMVKMTAICKKMEETDK